MIRIRTAVQTDLDWLVNELQVFAVHYKRPSMFPGEVRARQIVTDLVLSHVVFIADNTVARLGFIAGSVFEHPWSGERLLHEHFWWVVPTSRGSSVGHRLLVAFEAEARARSASVVMSLLPHSGVDGKSLERRGYQLQEYSYLLDPAMAGQAALAGVS